MNREQALNSFWNSFGVKAYDENTVPDDAPIKKLTYETIVNEFGVSTAISVSIYDRSTSWKSVTDILELIDNRLKDGGATVQCDRGIIWLKKGTPFAQRFNDDTDDTVRRIILNIEIEYLEV
ncbi:MAG TPA: hypothetical protein DHV37_05765 [Erysipelotrichaceae bacterium]|nr:hypothetical protein [Erysipelotrichaceae bacterium]